MTAQTVDTSKLWDMIKDIRFGMLTVRGADGSLYSRPMTTQNGEADRGGVHLVLHVAFGPAGGRSCGSRRT